MLLRIYGTHQERSYFDRGVICEVVIRPRSSLNDERITHHLDKALVNWLLLDLMNVQQFPYKKFNICRVNTIPWDRRITLTCKSE